MVKAGEAGSRCEFINVESEFAALSVAIGASAAGARAYTATASQGLLFMAEAVYNAFSLGTSDCDDGCQPCHWRTDQHLERPHRQHVDARCGLDTDFLPKPTRKHWICISRHFVSQKSCPCRSWSAWTDLSSHTLTSGSICRTQEQVDRLSATLRTPPGARPQRASHHRCHGRPRSLCRSALPGPRQADASPRTPDPASGQPSSSQVFGRDSGGLIKPYRLEDAETMVIALGSVLGTIKDTVDDTACRQASRLACWESPRSVLSRSADDPGRHCRCQAHRGAWKSALPWALAASSHATCAVPCKTVPSRCMTVIAGSGWACHHQSVAERRCCCEAIEDKLEQLTFLDMDWGIVNRVLERELNRTPFRPHCRGYPA
jgi:pyruvate ferredoxin oxidoreductase alpha subunit